MIKPNFFVRDIPIYGDVILSPMAGYSDVPYRAICRVYGSCMQYTEFVPVEMLLGKPNALWRALDKKRAEFPVVFQIFGNSAELILRAAQRIETGSRPPSLTLTWAVQPDEFSGRGTSIGMI